MLARTSARAASTIAMSATLPTKLPTPKGYLTPRDLRDYKVRSQRATKISYRGHDVYGMAPSSSGGTTVGEALNILERFPLGTVGTTAALHHYLEASALAFADRGRYLGDPAAAWRICDANLALDPDALAGDEGEGRVLAIPGPGV